MDKADLPLFQGPDEQRLSFDLLRKLLAAIDQWGKAQGGRSADALDRVVMEGLLQTVSAICVSRELSKLGMTPTDTQAFFRHLYKGEGLVRAEDSEPLLQLQARKEVLLGALRRAVSLFGEVPTPAAQQPSGAEQAGEGAASGSVADAEIYANYRIHPTLLPSGSWIVSIVQLGMVKERSRSSGSRVERVRGEYPSQVDAVLAAKRYIDQHPDEQADGL